MSRYANATRINKINICDLIQDPEILIYLSPEELAYHLLKVANFNLQSGLVHKERIISTEPIVGEDPKYLPQYSGEVQLALLEAITWLEVNGLLLPAPGVNGQNGHKVFGRRGKTLLEKSNFDSFVKAAEFPKSLLHTSIANRAWLSLARGELAEAVFTSFRSVEEAVRNAGGYPAAEIGVTLMRKAFNPDSGPLTDMNQPAAEREALMQLFAGAIGSYKNPHSHRTVTISDPREAQEMVLLASHLLRIVELRVQNRNA